jgi:two-component system OmpR family response regulator
MRVLVAEDDPHLREILVRGLGEERYVVESFGRGDDADAALSVGTYDLAVLDWNLPGMSGLDVCRHLRANRRNVPVLMLTARDAEADRVSGLDAGADDYIVKPFAFDELLARLRALARRGAGISVQAGVGGVVLDQGRREAHVGDRSLRLSPREYAILERLVFSAGKVVSRGELARSTLPDESRIRGALAGAGAQARIVTVRGVGFRLVEHGAG